MTGKTIYLTILLSMVTFVVAGQETKTTANSSNTEEVNEGGMQEEVVDGIWELTGYLGKKLMNEMSSRMNLGESKSEEEIRKKRVKIKVGSFEMERIETQ